MLLPARQGPHPAARRRTIALTGEWSPELVALAAVVLVGGLLRLTTLGSQSYWVDEATTVHELHLSFGALLHEIRVNETTPPLYFVLAWLWAKLFGTGEVGLRLMSGLLGIGLIPLVYLCARELLSRWAAVLAAALAALSPFLIWYSQEARSYALFALLCSASLLFCLRSRAEPTRRNLVLWTIWSTLAIFTHFFAGFLVAAEALLLLVSVRSRALLAGCAVIALAQLAVLPLAVGDTSHPLNWIQAFPLSTRIQQVPVQLGLGQLFQSGIVAHGLAGAALLAVVVAALLLFAGGRRERRAAVVGAVLAGAVILVPILLAVLGRDYLVPRNLMPAWTPLAVVIVAACTVPRARVGGAMLAVAVLAGSVWADVEVGTKTQYQRPDWRGVAAALGTSRGSRAIVADQGNFATQPLSVYLGAPWLPPGPAPTAVSEVDVVRSAFAQPARSLPAGMRLLSSKSVNQFRVERFVIAGGWDLPPAQILARASRLVSPALPGGSVLIQRPGTRPLA